MCVVHTPRYFMALASSSFWDSDVIFGVARPSSWYDLKDVSSHHRTVVSLPLLWKIDC